MAQVQKVCLCQLDEKQYGFPIEKIIRIIRAVEVTDVPNAEQNTIGVFDYQGTILPVMNIRARLGLPKKELDVDDRLILINSTSIKYAIVVDSVSDVVILDEKNSSNAGASMHDAALQKVAKLPNGIAFIFDIDNLFKANEVLAVNSLPQVDLLKTK